jgi:hypothetical protein
MASAEGVILPYKKESRGRVNERAGKVGIRRRDDA